MTRSGRKFSSIALRAGLVLAATLGAGLADAPADRDPARLVGAGRFREAAGLLEATPAASAAGTEGRVLLGRAYLGLGRYDEAAVALEPPGPARSEPDRLEALARVAEARGELDRALDLMARAVEERRKSLPSAESLDGSAVLADARTLLAALAFRAGKLDLAKDQFGKAIAAIGEAHARLHAQDIPHDERDPRLAAIGATAGLARVYGAMSDPARAERGWRSVMARTDDPSILADVAAFYEARSDIKTARRHRERALKLAAGKPACRRTRALLLAERPEGLDEALALAEAAFADGPDIAARDALAWVLHRRGEDARAREVIRPALELGTRDPTVLFHAGVIAQARGDAAEARRLLAACLERNPGFDPVAGPEASKRLQDLR